MSAAEDIKEANSTDSDPAPIQKNDVNLSVNSFSYAWTLNNFSEFLKFPSAKIRSPFFSFKGSKWNLIMYSECKGEEPRLVKVRLMMSRGGGANAKDTQHCVQHKFTLVDSKGSTMTREGCSSMADDIPMSHRLPFLVDEIQRELPAVVLDDRLTVICELVVLTSAGESESKQPAEQKSFLPVDKKTLVVDSSSRALSRMDRLQLFVVVPLLLIYLLSMPLLDWDIARSKALPLSNREVNELIIDSTFKIKSIAEALNLTEVEMKSSELISMFEGKFNLSEDFPRIRGYLQKPAHEGDLSLKVPLFNLENNTVGNLD